MKKITYLLFINACILNGMEQTETKLNQFMQQCVTQFMDTINGQEVQDIDSGDFYKNFPSLRNYNAPQNQLAITSKDGTLRLLNDAIPFTDNGIYTNVPDGYPSNNIFFYQFNCDGQQIAMTVNEDDSNTASIFVWNPVTGKPLKVLTSASQRASWLAYHPTKQNELASAHSNKNCINFWDTAQGALTSSIALTAQPDGINYNPSGENLACVVSDQNYIQIWNPEEKKSFIIGVWPEVPGLREVTYFPDGKKFMSPEFAAWGLNDQYAFPIVFQNFTNKLNKLDFFAFNQDGTELIAISTTKSKAVKWNLTQFNKSIAILLGYIANKDLIIFNKLASGGVLTAAEKEELVKIGFWEKPHNISESVTKCCCTIS